MNSLNWNTFMTMWVLLFIQLKMREFFDHRQFHFSNVFWPKIDSYMHLRCMVAYNHYNNYLEWFIPERSFVRFCLYKCAWTIVSSTTNQITDLSYKPHINSICLTISIVIVWTEFSNKISLTLDICPHVWSMHWTNCWAKWHSCRWMLSQ